jgi:hypothetical protein
LETTIKSTAISIRELTNEQKHYSMGTREEQSLFEEYVWFQNIFPSLNVGKMMCGMEIVSIGTDAKGNINIKELKNLW